MKLYLPDIEKFINEYRDFIARCYFSMLIYYYFIKKLKRIEIELKTRIVYESGLIARFWELI